VALLARGSDPPNPPMAYARFLRHRAVASPVAGPRYGASHSRWCGCAQSSTGPAGTIRCGLRCGWVV
jgi:hypothetical protein